MRKNAPAKTSIASKYANYTNNINRLRKSHVVPMTTQERSALMRTKLQDQGYRRISCWIDAPSALALYEYQVRNGGLTASQALQQLILKSSKSISKKQSTILRQSKTTVKKKLK